LANLKEGFAGESQANRRYLYFARKADIEGIRTWRVFRDTAEGETGHAFGHFDFMAVVGDPVTGVPVGDTDKNLKSAIEGETYEYTQMYPVSPRRLVKRALKRFPSGLKRSRGRRNRTPGGSPRRWTASRNRRNRRTVR
jgi:rubrerythrin